jgi:CheY-like chemotaxis protein
MRQLRILMVEDSADDAELLLRALRRAGYEISYERVETPAAMQAALNQPEWNLVISDYTMPHFNGLDALRLVREQTADLPFILVSGTIGEEVAVQAVKAGANDYVLKDNLARLCSAIERELNDADARKAQRRIESRYENLFNTVPVGVLFVAPDGRVMHANPVLLRMLALEGETLVGPRISRSRKCSYRWHPMRLIFAGLSSRMTGRVSKPSWRGRGVQRLKTALT